MRRIVLAAVPPPSPALVLLFSYHTDHARRRRRPWPLRPRRRHGADDRRPPGAGRRPRPRSGRTFTGDAAQTRWGPVQVEITVADGKITDVTAVQCPHGNGRDQEINAYALPVLTQEAVAGAERRHRHGSAAPP